MSRVLPGFIRVLHVAYFSDFNFSIHNQHIEDVFSNSVLYSGVWAGTVLSAVSFGSYSSKCFSA